MTTKIDDQILRAQLGKTLGATDFPELGAKYEGKVRDCYVRDGRRTLIATDRLSAFDVVLGTIPFKGQVLNQMAAFWFEATADLCPNHVINVPAPTVTVARTSGPARAM
jgi:phosphoribosylaminoimidazole-succinocarboxamide synthase